MSTAILIAGKPGPSTQSLDVPTDAISIDGNAPEAGDYAGRRFLQLRLIDWKPSQPAWGTVP